MGNCIGASGLHKARVLLLVASLFMLGFTAVPSSAKAVEIEMTQLEYRIGTAANVFYSGTYNGFIMIELARTDFNLQPGERVVASIESYDTEKQKWIPRKVVVLGEGEEAQTLSGDRLIHVTVDDSGDSWKIEKFRLVLSGDGFESKQGSMTLVWG
ncbi:hypothetical protein [Paenibacillus sp. Z6-24]